jgi:hypothetical protein
MSHAVLLEADAVLDARNSIFGRAELVQKSAEELVLDTPPYGFAPDDRFDVGAISLGYIRELARFGPGTLGLGVMGTINVVPAALSPAYGSRTPAAATIFLRVRPFRSAMSMHGTMDRAAVPGDTHSPTHGSHP